MSFPAGKIAADLMFVAPELLRERIEDALVNAFAEGGEAVAEQLTEDRDVAIRERDAARAVLPNGALELLARVTDSETRIVGLRAEFGILREELVAECATLIAERAEAVAALRETARRVRNVAEFYPDMEGLPEGDPDAVAMAWEVLAASLTTADAILARHPVKP